MDYIGLLLSIFIIIAIAIVSEFSITFAAIGGTAPVTSILAIILVYRQNSSQEVTLEFAWKLVKGISASLAFAITFYISLSRQNSIWESLALSFVVWISIWLSSESEFGNLRPAEDSALRS